MQECVCAGDLNYDRVVDFADMLLVLTGWGTCIVSGPEPDTLEELIEGAGLEYPEDWEALEDCMANEDPDVRENCACWMDHYYYVHYLGVCFCQPDCPDSDPWGGSHYPY